MVIAGGVFGEDVKDDGLAAFELHCVFATGVGQAGITPLRKNRPLADHATCRQFAVDDLTHIADGQATPRVGITHVVTIGHTCRNEVHGCLHDFARFASHRPHRLDLDLVLGEAGGTEDIFVVFGHEFDVRQRTFEQALHGQKRPHLHRTVQADPPTHTQITEHLAA